MRSSITIWPTPCRYLIKGTSYYRLSSNMLRTVLFVTLNFPTIFSAVYLRGPQVLVDVILESLESWFRLDSKIPELILLFLFTK